MFDIPEITMLGYLTNNMLTFCPKSLRAQLLLLVCLLVLPMLGIVVYNGAERQQREIEEAVRDTSGVLQTLAHSHERTVGSTQRFLMTLAKLPAVQNRDAAACNKLFNALLKENPAYATILAVTPEGMIFANALPVAPYSVAERSFFREALRTRKFSAGEYLIGATTKRRVLPFAYPVIDANGRLKGVIAAGLDLDHYGTMFGGTELSDGSSLGIFDRQSICLYHSDGPDKYVGKADFPGMDGHMAADPEQGVFRAANIDGAGYFAAYGKFYLEGNDSPYLVMRVSIPEKTALSRARNLLHRNLYLLVIACVLGLISSWFIGSVAKKSEDKYRNIFENAVEGIYQSTPQGKYVRVNPSLARMAGYDSPKEMMNSVSCIGRQVYVVPEDRVRFKELIEEHGAVEAFEIQHYRKDRSVFWASVSARLVKDGGGKHLYYEGTIEDVTKRKLAEAEAQEAIEKLRRTLNGTIQAMSLAVEARDPYTSGHQKRVSKLAGAIGEEMGLDADLLDNIRMGGTIHDIGKISVPAEILSKPTKLSPVEFNLIKTHAQIGYDIVKEAELPCSIAQTVLQHHERLDGSGYPLGLKDGQIMLEARILAVADAVEAIASHRPYRPALGIVAALREIEDNRDILYDRDVADACIRLFREKGFTLE